MNTLNDFKSGDKVKLSNGVLHQEYAGRIGTVKKTIKSRNEVVVEFDDGTKPYYAYPQNVHKITTDDDFKEDEK